MASSFQYAAPAPAPARSGGTDLAAWAVVAIVVAIVAAGAGYVVARQDTPGAGDVARSSDLAARTGFARGERSGYADGTRLGRSEANAKVRARVAAERAAATREGYQAGYENGRARAGDPNALPTGGFGATGTYPSMGYEDVLAADLFGSDAPGYSDSAFETMGYGTSAVAPFDY